ncbi:conserved hypothetical protein [Candidatus Sulfopaludibacter sp. SbA3]|nr:conserved hypothetical protein [Candidatus Sulfopaludibacter sp. SbA3]
MSNVADRLELCEAVLALIEKKRTEKKDLSLGAALEQFVLDAQVQELEQEILENPGAIEPWLVRRRRMEN